MPPFRQGPIEVDPGFNGEALKELRDIGHGHRINIVDRSYDIPRDAKMIDFPGSTAEAFTAVVKLIPVEDNTVEIMDPDPALERPGINVKAPSDLAGITEQLEEELGGVGEPSWRYRLSEDQHRNHQLSGQAALGFYDLVNDPSKPSLFIRTIDDLPFACASLVVGHAQRTE